MLVKYGLYHYSFELVVEVIDYCKEAADEMEMIHYLFSYFRALDLAVQVLE